MIGDIYSQKIPNKCPNKECNISWENENYYGLVFKDQINLTCLRCNSEFILKLKGDK